MLHPATSQPGHSNGAKGRAAVIPGQTCPTGPAEWTLWDGFQTLPKPSPPSLTRGEANRGALRARARQRRRRLKHPATPDRWTKRDGFQTLCNADFPKWKSNR